MGLIASRCRKLQTHGIVEQCLPTDQVIVHVQAFNKSDIFSYSMNGYQQLPGDATFNWIRLLVHDSESVPPDQQRFMCRNKDVDDVRVQVATLTTIVHETITSTIPISISSIIGEYAAPSTIGEWAVRNSQGEWHLHLSLVLKLRNTPHPQL